MIYKIRVSIYDNQISFKAFIHYNISMSSTELEVFKYVENMIKLRNYPKPLTQRLLYYFEKTDTKSWRNKNQESFLILIALEGPAKVLEQMKSTLAVLAALSTIFLSITVPLSLEPGDFSNVVVQNLFGCFMVTSTLMSFTAVMVSTFMRAQCELCDVTAHRMDFLKRLDNHPDMIIITSNIWSIGGMVMSLPAMVIKATDSYGLWMSLYFGIMSAALIKYTLCDLVKSVIHKRTELQRKRFTDRLVVLGGVSLTDKDDADQIWSECRKKCFLY